MQLREYQQADVDFLAQFKAAGCFNEQRTGKTPTAIMTMHTKGVTKLVVVCPKSAIYPWVDSYKAWTGLPAVALVGTQKQRLKALQNWEQGAIVISYGCLKTTANTRGMVADVLKKQPQGIIVDEAHRMKDPKSAQTQAVLSCIRIPHRLVLTGTLAAGKLQNAFAILKFIAPALYPSYWKFINEYFIVSKRHRYGGGVYTEIGDMFPLKEKQLQRWLAGHSTQRKRKDVMPWLPPKVYEDIRLPLSTHQERYLKELAKFYETEHVVTQGTLDRLIRYRQICLSPSLVGLKGSSPKTNWVLDYLQDYPDTSTIIFSKFTAYIKELSALLQIKKIDCCEIVGDTSTAKRTQIVNAFQKGEFNVLLLNIDAGKEALTLDKAETTIFMDQFPPASDILQAEDRFVATTKAGADKAHKIIRVMMKDSYDETIFKLVQQNAQTIDLLNDYHKYLKQEKEKK